MDPRLLFNCVFMMLSVYRHYWVATVLNTLIYFHILYYSQFFHELRMICVCVCDVGVYWKGFTIVYIFIRIGIIYIPGIMGFFFVVDILMWLFIPGLVYFFILSWGLLYVDRAKLYKRPDLFEAWCLFLC